MDIDVRAIQLKQLEILKAVADVCERNGLRYCLDGGTCLGAIRHQGFIPWDDDVDIGMPREDFDRFRQIAPQELPEHLQVLDFEKVRHSPQLHLKVHDIRSTLISKYSFPFPDAHTGVFIDIFSYDAIPPAGLARRWWLLRKDVLMRVNWLLRTYSRSDSLSEKLVGAAAGLLRRCLPFNWASLRLEKMLRRRDISTEKTAVLLVGRKRFEFPSACLLERAWVPFEDGQFPCPADYETYLTLHYGDWRTLPPEERRRHTHSILYISLDKSYLDRWWEEKKA